MKFIVKTALSLMSIIFVLGTLIFPSSVLSSEIVIIANSACELSSISSSELKRLWLGKTDKINNVKIQPIDCKELKEATAKFSEVVLKKTSKQIKKYFIKESLKGGASPPISFKTSAMLFEELSKNSKVISFVDKESFEEMNNSDLKMIAVDGKKYQQTGYVLR